MAADSGFDFLWEHGFKVEIVIGDLDSTQLKPENLGIPYKKYPPDKDESDAQLAFLYAQQVLQWSKWQVIGGSGQRIDHFLALLSLIPQFPEWEEWWLENDHAYLLSEGKSLVCPSAPGQRVSLLPVGFTLPRVESSGLRWPVEHLDWKQQCSLSNETSADNFRVQCIHGNLMIIRSLEVAVEFRI